MDAQLKLPKEALASGTLWDDRYEIVSFIGRGASTHAYEAQDRALDRKVALKIYRFTDRFDNLSFEQLFFDFHLRQTLQHPLVVPIYKFGLSPRPYTVAELAPHRNLMHFIALHGLPSPEQSLALIE